MRQQQAEESGDEEADPQPAPETVFDPPMPPELPAPVEPAPAPEAPEPPPTPAQARAAAIEATRAEVSRRIFRYEHLMTHHPELSSRIHDLTDARAYFDDADNLLPPELWPKAWSAPGIMTIDYIRRPDG